MDMMTKSWRRLAEALGPGMIDLNGMRPPLELPVPEDEFDESAFSRLSHKLDKQPGVTDPDALAAAIGRKKYGAAGMAAKSAAGRKH